MSGSVMGTVGRREMATHNPAAPVSPSTPLCPLWETFMRVPEAVALTFSASSHLSACLPVSWPLQCFDLESYLQLNCERGTWRCPVCK